MNYSGGPTLEASWYNSLLQEKQWLINCCPCRQSSTCFVRWIYFGRSNASLDIVKLPSPSELVATIIHPKIELKTIHSRAILKKEISLKSAVEQWGNLGAFVSSLYTSDYELLSRSMKDKVIEPLRAMLIPKFDEMKEAALQTGALGSGISGSGPSVFALSKGAATANKVGEAMKKIYDSIGLDHDIHISPINETGIKIL